jgi:tetratricopeptide (TPR) repeat protein
MEKVSGYDLIRNGKINEALVFFEENFRRFLDKDSECVIKVIKYLLSKVKKIKDLKDPYRIADTIVSEWPKILGNINLEGCSENVELIESVKYYLFFTALKYYTQIIDNINQDDVLVVRDTDLMLKISRCYRELRMEDKAIDILEEVRSYNQTDSVVLSILGDLYFQMGDIDRAKLFFREAFFWDPQRIELDEVRCPIVKTLMKTVKTNGYRNEEVNEWIPVYGAIENIFDVRRELSKEEVDILIRRIQALESDFLKHREWRNITEPRLINSYLWLIDYYYLQLEDYELAKSVGVILQKFSPSIYNKLKLGGYKWL